VIDCKSLRLCVQVETIATKSFQLLERKTKEFPDAVIVQFLLSLRLQITRNGRNYENLCRYYPNELIENEVHFTLIEGAKISSPDGCFGYEMASLSLTKTKKSSRSGRTSSHERWKSKSKEFSTKMVTLLADVAKPS
jgi:hypothetical protein